MLDRMEKVESVVKGLIGKIVEESERKLVEHEEEIQRLGKEIENVEVLIAKERNAIENLKNLELGEREEFEENEKLALWLNIVETYERNLGMRIRKLSPYMLEVCFLYITPHYSENRIQLHLSTDGVYTVPECYPSIHSLNEIVSQLNTTKHLPTFFQSLRKSFQSTYSS